MRLTAKGEYGLQALLELALTDGRTPMQARTISRNQRIPLRFLEQVLSALKKSGLVESHRGAQGGYILARLPSEIRLGDLIEAIEGPITPTSCMAGGTEGPCWHEAELDYCVIKETGQNIRNSIREALNAITLQDLCEQKKEREHKRVLMYHI